MNATIKRACCAIASSVATIGVVAASAPAAASVPSAAPSLTVRISDLDLASRNGRAAAEARIRDAAARVCEAAPNAFSSQTCRRKAEDEAMHALDLLADRQGDGSVVLR